MRCCTTERINNMRYRYRYTQEYLNRWTFGVRSLRSYTTLPTRCPRSPWL